MDNSIFDFLVSILVCEDAGVLTYIVSFDGVSESFTDIKSLNVFLKNLIKKIEAGKTILYVLSYLDIIFTSEDINKIWKAVENINNNPQSPLFSASL